MFDGCSKTVPTVHCPGKIVYMKKPVKDCAFKRHGDLSHTPWAWLRDTQPERRSDFPYPGRNDQALMVGRADPQRTCHMAPMPIESMKILMGQSIQGICNRSPIRTVPDTKGQKKRAAAEGFHFPNSHLPAQSAT